MRQQILRHLTAVAFECAGHTAELSMKRSCDNRGVAMALPREQALDETTANVCGGGNERPRLELMCAPYVLYVCAINV